MDKSLYERLGGNEAIGAIMNEAVDLHLANPLIATRFRSSDLDKLRKLGHEFFCAGSGGPETYTGRELREAHAGMNINEQELVAAIDDIVKAMDKHGVAEREKNEVIAILYSLKEHIVRI